MKKVIFIALLGFTIGSCIVLSSSYFDKASATVMGKKVHLPQPHCTLRTCR